MEEVVVVVIDAVVEDVVEEGKRRILKAAEAAVVVAAGRTRPLRLPGVVEAVAPELARAPNRDHYAPRSSLTSEGATIPSD